MISILVLALVNGSVLYIPQVIYSVPTIAEIPRGFILPTKVDANAFKLTLMNKWNGMSIVVFKYHNENDQTFVSMKPRAFEFYKYLEEKEFKEEIKAKLGLCMFVVVVFNGSLW